ncbi:MAG TPA: ABC transporter permease, partial [Gemmatimonadaceae bacterium]|nr:ABC transporter permease [Gemmatimonadaceae bacterium]
MALRALHALVRVLPRPFRDEFGAEIRADIARYHAAARAAGPRATLSFTLATAFDLVRAAVAERVRPSIATPALPTPPAGDTMGSFTDWMRDLRHAMRTLRRSPGFAAVTIGTLGLAIGANAGMFSVVNRVILDPLPFGDPGRLVYVGGTAPGSQLPQNFGLADEFALQYREQSKLIEGAAVFGGGTSTLRVGDRVERVRMGFPEWQMFPVLGVKPELGRLPVAGDEGNVALISHATWQTWFGGDSSVIGKTYSISYQNRMIIGVLPDEFNFPNDGTQVWVPYATHAAQIRPGNLGQGMIARMKPGVTPEALAAELTTLAKRLPDRFGGSANYAKLIGQFHAVVRPLREQILGDTARALWILFAAVGIVLVIACANVANLFLVRSEGRHREMAVRRAIGAGRGELMRLQLAESVIVALAAGVVAVALARVVLPLAVAVAPPGVPRIATVHVSLTTIAFTAGAAIVTALA